MKKIQNPYKMNWKAGTKVVFQKAPILRKHDTNSPNDPAISQIMPSGILSSVKAGEELTILTVCNAAVPYADVETRNGHYEMVDLRNLRKV